MRDKSRVLRTSMLLVPQQRAYGLQQVKVSGVPRAPKPAGFITKTLDTLRVVSHILGPSKLQACML